MGGGGGSSSSKPVEAPNSLLSNSTINITDGVCEGPIKGFVAKSGTYGTDPLCSTYFDNIPVRNLDGSYNFNVSGAGFKFYYTLGTANQGVMTGFDKVENTVPLSSNTLLSNPPAGAGAHKWVTASFNTASYPDASSVKVTVSVPSLYTADDEGNIDRYTISYAVDISLNNGPFQQIDAVTLNGKCTNAYSETRTYTLPKTNPSSNFYQWTLRVRKTSKDILSVKTQASIYVANISVVSSSSFVYPNTVMVGTHLLASQFSSIPTRAYLLDGLLVSVPNGYTPTAYNVDGTITPASYPPAWTGDWQTGVWTDNPAFVFNDVLTNKRYGLGLYMPPNSVDKWSLYQIAQYCDELVDSGLGDGKQEPRFTFNAAITQQTEAYNVLMDLASVFRGMVYYANGTIQTTQTTDKTPVYNYTNANVIEGQFNYADSAKTSRATVVKVKWLDPQNLYRENIEFVEDTEGLLKYGYVEKEITAFACTSRGQAYRLGNWTILSEKLLTETVNFRVSLEGVYVRPGDVFNIYDNFRTNRNQGGRIVSIDSGRSTIELDRSISLDSGVTYVFSAITPNATLSPEDVADSTQANLIRNTQIEERRITTSPTSGTTTITVDQPFSTGLYGSVPWIITASGGGNLLNNAGVYQCLSVGEAEPGIFEVVGLQYNTGINRLVDYGYNVDRWGVNSGDPSPIDPPTNLEIVPVTGAMANNQFYHYLRLNWTPPTGTNLAYYAASGKAFGGNWELINNIVEPTTTYSITATGLTEFRVAAVSRGGVISDHLTGSYVVPYANPLGYVTNVSGLILTVGADPNYLGPDGQPTGYFSRTPGFAWGIPLDDNGNETVSAQFIDYYRFSLLDAGTNTPLITPIVISGADNRTYQLSSSQIGSNRLFKARVEAVDVWGNSSAPLDLVVNNPVPRTPIATGFTASARGFNYSITPNPRDLDVSGVYLWCNDAADFTPDFSNATSVSTNLAGTVNHDYGDSYYVWHALTDTFGTANTQIYGPVYVDVLSGISGIQNQLALVYGMVGSGLSGIRDIVAQITGASGLAGDLQATGIQLNAKINSLSGSSAASFNNLSFALAQTGSALAGSITTLSSNVNSEFGSVYSAISNEEYARSQADNGLATSINTVSSRVNTLSGYTNAIVSQENFAMTTASGALASQINTVSSTVNGMSASVTTLSNAYIIGGQAIATWGFQLDSNGKVVSMQAIAASGGSQPTIGTIIFGGADLQSDNYSAGSAGWKLTHNGDLEVNNGTFRGLVKASSIDHACMFIREPGGTEGGQIFLELTEGNFGAWAMDVYTDNSLRFFVESNPTVDATARAEFGASLYAREFIISSSKELKKNIRPINGVLPKLLDLRGVKYERRYLPDFHQYVDDKTEIGMIAEEVAPLFPELVDLGKGGYLGISYSRFVPLLIEGLKEEDAKVSDLQQRVNSLEAQISGLMARLATAGL